MSNACLCPRTHGKPRRVVLTGGPGAGKTAFLELVQQSFCTHVAVLPEAATIVYGGGFPREDRPDARRAAQRAIFHVQRELESVADGWEAAVVVCDRGTVDGGAYLPDPEELWSDVGTTLDAELGRYAAVIHLRSPGRDGGYDHSNPLRVETPEEAAGIDARIERLWAAHPRRIVVSARSTFLAKAASALDALRREVPECCREHAVAAMHSSSPLL